MVVINEVVDSDVSLSGSMLVVIGTVEGRAVDELAATDDVEDVNKVVSLIGSSLVATVVEGYSVDVKSSVDEKSVSLWGS